MSEPDVHNTQKKPFEIGHSQYIYKFSKTIKNIFDKENKKRW